MNLVGTYGLACFLLALFGGESAGGEALEIEERLNRHFWNYQERSREMNFAYAVEQRPGHLDMHVIRMSTRHAKSKWKRRSITRFERFLQNAARLASQLSERNVRVFIWDEQGRDLGQYEFVREKDELKKAILRFDVFEQALERRFPMTSTALEHDLEAQFGVYSDERTFLLFDYTVVRYRDSLHVWMRGENFSIEEKAWQDREPDKFDEFVESVWRYVKERMFVGPLVTVLDRDRRVALEKEEIFAAVEHFPRLKLEPE